ncbi:MAG: PKD domain-containing protein [bacterium]|jgi:PKD repeat protein
MKGAVLAIVALIAAAALACERSSSSIVSPDAATTPVLSPHVDQSAGSAWPESLPSDFVQPWEKTDERGFVIPEDLSGDERAASAICPDCEFVPGVEWYQSSGYVSESGEAASISSGQPGERLVSYAIYRIPFGGEEPGIVTADVNLKPMPGGAQSEYWIGLSDYANGTWKWRGPFTDSQLRLGAGVGDYTSPLGIVYVAIVAFDGAAFDCVGISIHPRDSSDEEPPPVPGTPTLTPVAGGILVEWPEVAASDLAGYYTIISNSDFGRIFEPAIYNQQKLEAQIYGLPRIIVPTTAKKYIAVASIDTSCNTHSFSEVKSAAPLSGDCASAVLTASAASAGRNETVTLTATGGDNYDFDLDGDGDFDQSNSTGIAQADTSNTGIIRPSVRCTNSGGGVAFAAVSIVVTSNSRPVALGIGSPTSGVAPLDVQFEGWAEDDDGTIEEYAWDFEGDGNFDWTSPADPNVQHTYTNPGIFNAKFRVTDDQGAWDVDTATIQVLPPDGPANSPPIADLIADTTVGMAPLEVSFNATGSSDADGSIVEYAWDWDGNGQYDAITDGGIARYTFNSAGSPQVKVRVEDDDGARATDTITITVNVEGNEPPEVTLSAIPESGDAPLPTILDASLSWDADGEIVRYEWDFDNDGTYEAYGEANFALHTYIEPGLYVARVRVTDDDGAQTSDTVSIDVGVEGNEAPIAEIAANPTSGNCPLTVDFSASASTDSDGYIVRFDWDFDGDGNYEVYDGGAVLSYTYGYYGEFDAWVRVTDDDGEQDSAGHGISVNAAPTAALQLIPNEVETGESVRLSGTCSSDPDGNLSKYEWDSDGNGSFETDTGTTNYLDKTYSTAGYYTIKLRVTDDDGAMAVDDKSLIVRGWGSPQTLDSAGVTGSYTSLSIVNQNPAICYFDDTNDDLRYIRSSDTSGSSWGMPVTVDSAGHVGTDCSLTVIGGNPAISYFDAINDELRFVRANDSDGNSWGASVIVDSVGTVGTYTSLCDIAGYPAISYYDYGNGDLKYVRATNANGTSWSASITVDSTGITGQYTSLSIVNLNPAISYYDSSNGDLRFVRASDGTGSIWGTPVTVDSVGNVGRYTSLKVVNSRPAISYYDFTYGDLRYVRSLDLSGATWDMPVIPDSTDISGEYTSLAVLAGRPAISYFSTTNDDLKFVWAIDANGDAWGLPQILDSTGSTGYYTSLTTAGGNPAISYFDSGSGDLRFIRMVP